MKYEQAKELLQQRYKIKEADFSEEDPQKDYIYHKNDEIMVFPTSLIQLCNNDNYVEFVHLITKLDNQTTPDNFVVTITDLLKELDDIIYGKYNIGDTDL